MGEDTKKEIDEMLNALGGVVPGASDEGDEGDEGESPEDKAKREQEEADATKAKEEEEAAEAARIAEEEERKGETEDEKKAREEKEASDAEAEAKKKETDALAEIERDKEAAKKAEEDRLKAEEDKKKNDEPLKLEEQDFIGDLDLYDLTSDKTALNKILNAVYSKGVNDSKKIATEGVLNTIPEIVKYNITLLTSLKEASDKFYAENKELVPYKRVVAAVFEEIASKNPDKKYNELMNLVAPEARKRLNLQKQAVKEDKESEGKDGKPPRLHGARGNQRQAPSKQNLSSLENEISEMNKTLGR